jgi:hypothetical protein
MSQRPAAIGLLVCEQVIIEEDTHNVTPVNCFAKRFLRQFPSEPVTFVVFALLNDGNGNVNLNVVVQRLDVTLEEIYRISAAAVFRDQLQEMRCVFRIRNFSFPSPGAYQVSLFADGEIIAQRRLRITKKDAS